jgi:aerobic-type carbon monoxide dehydrogenase small subunit (CoxS/CutS family)
MSESITLTVNGVDYPVTVEQGRNLLSVLRTEVGLTGTKEGCDDCECGACMVLLDGQPVNSCSYLAVQVAGRPVTTVEGLAHGDQMATLQRCLLEEGGVQCGFCTPGMLVSATALLERNAAPSEEEVRIGLSGNLCRCTGYARIVAAAGLAAVQGADRLGHRDDLHLERGCDRAASIQMGRAIGSPGTQRHRRR